MNIEKDDDVFGGEKKGREIKRKERPVSKTPLLDYYGVDLTHKASLGELDKVYGREKEITSMINILNKKKKNNPMLIGESGVGKTSIVEGLAQKICDKQAGFFLSDKRIVEINMASIIAGTKYRGEFEQRVEEILKEIESAENVIVFIDEIHNVVGAGGTTGSLDAANILKPALSNGALKCIGATTLEEYKKHIEKENAFNRRFQKVKIKEPTKSETVDLIMFIKGIYEQYHGVTYSQKVVEKCVDLADRYISYKKFPDKAIDVLDEAGSIAKSQRIKTPQEFKELEDDLRAATIKKKEASINQDFEMAAKWRDKERNIIKTIDVLKQKVKENINKTKFEIQTEHIAKVISLHTGIPINKLTEEEGEKLKMIGKTLSEKIIGQDFAVKKVTEAIQRSRLGFGDPNKPIASFLFLGSTGVGKTYLAKMLAENIFNTQDSFIRIDMSEFKEKHSLSKLIGSPPGYVGYEERGQLTEKIKNNPYSIVLLDEIEKAHPDVFNVLLQVLDDGKLTDSSGGEVNFKNTIIIMTSNIGTRYIVENKKMGFEIEQDNNSDNRKSVLKELSKKFSPEFLNRIDEKIVFNLLENEQILKIISIEIEKSLNGIREKGYKITFDKNVVNYIANNGMEKKYGARPIKRMIMNEIVREITKGVLDEKIKKGKTYKITTLNNKIIIKNVRDKKR